MNLKWLAVARMNLKWLAVARMHGKWPLGAPRLRTDWPHCW
jgi:hypothetical protein